MVTDYVAPSLLSARKKRPKAAAHAPPQVHVAALALEAEAGPGPGWQDESEPATQASQAPTQDRAAAAEPPMPRKRAFAAAGPRGVRGKENSLPQED